LNTIFDARNNEFLSTIWGGILWVYGVSRRIIMEQPVERYPIVVEGLRHPSRRHRFIGDDLCGCERQAGR
jgi:hypothetical protein